MGQDQRRFYSWSRTFYACWNSNLCTSKTAQILLSDRDRHVIAFGADGLGATSSTAKGDGVQDPMLIRFSDQENPIDWYPTDTNTAGDLRIDTGSKIMQAVETRQQILVFTDVAIYAMQFIGPHLRSVSTLFLVI